jgi:hypothetical protein
MRKNASLLYYAKLKRKAYDTLFTFMSYRVEKRKLKSQLPKMFEVRLLERCFKHIVQEAKEGRRERE